MSPVLLSIMDHVERDEGQLEVVEKSHRRKMQRRLRKNRVKKSQKTHKKIF